MCRSTRSIRGCPARPRRGCSDSGRPRWSRLSPRRHCGCRADGSLPAAEVGLPPEVLDPVDRLTNGLRDHRLISSHLSGDRPGPRRSGWSAARAGRQHQDQERQQVRRDAGQVPPGPTHGSAASGRLAAMLQFALNCEPLTAIESPCREAGRGGRPARRRRGDGSGLERPRSRTSRCSGSTRPRTISAPAYAAPEANQLRTLGRLPCPGAAERAGLVLRIADGVVPLREQTPRPPAGSRNCRSRSRSARPVAASARPDGSSSPCWNASIASA
jgi:hypothetical protein